MSNNLNNNMDGNKQTDKDVKKTDSYLVEKNKENEIGEKHTKKENERVWKLFTEYKDWTNSNLLHIRDIDGIDTQIPRPMSRQGFETYLKENGHVLPNDFYDTFEYSDTRYSINNAIYQHLMDYAINGLFDKDVVHEIIKKSYPR